MRITTLALTTTLITAFAGSAASAQVVAQFNMVNHPDGILDPAYGLRFDGLFGGWAETVFDVEHFGDTLVTVYNDNGNLAISLTGTVYGGITDGIGGFVDPEAWAFEHVYTTGVVESQLGWQVIAPIGTNAGTLTRVSNPQDTITFFGKADHAGAQFLLEANGYRLDGDNTTWTGHGWLALPDGTSLTRDWFFVAEAVPSPATLGLLGLGGLVAARRRRA
ncbi:MAG: MYXO-CTERM domain-containing protein [Phycisphaerales bacterium]|jgi:MYXO-CTERM domain-containing protein